MNIALVIEGNNKVGGGYIFQKNYVGKIKKGKHKYIIYSKSSDFLKTIKTENISFKKIKKETYLDKLKKFILHFDATFFLFKEIILNFERQLINDQVDLVCFLSPSFDSFYFNKLNYIINVWDNCHIEHPEFPEIRNNFEFEKREILYNRVLKKSTSIIVESNQTKNNLIKRYLIKAAKIKVNNFKNVLSKNVEFDDTILKKTKIESPYIYYPAQYWSHKNHIYIIDVIKKLKELKININAIFSGSDKGNLKFLKDYSIKNRVENNIFFLDFIDESEKNTLIKNALAIVIPSFFGPTNLPQIESAIIGTPAIVAKSSVWSKNENNGFTEVDLKDPSDLAKVLMDLLNNKNLRNLMIKQSYQEINNPGNDILTLLEDCIEEFNFKKKAFK